MKGKVKNEGRNSFSSKSIYVTLVSSFKIFSSEYFSGGVAHISESNRGNKKFIRVGDRRKGHYM